jgi:hypothetical protein
MAKRFLKIFLAITSTLLWPALSAWACSVCFGGDGDHDGYNASVLFLMATPYLVFGSIVGGLIFAYRRTLKRRQGEESAEPVVQLTWNQEESGR